MKVTPRITIATGVIVAIAVGAWAYVDVREQDRARKQALEREGREVAGALRVTLEASTDWTRNAAAITRDLSRALAPWRVLVTPAPSGDPRERGGRTGNGDETLDAGQARRLEAFVAAPKLVIAGTDGDSFVVALPIRRTLLGVPDGMMTVGMVEVSRPIAFLADEKQDDVLEAALWVLLIAGVSTVAVGYLAMTLMSRPIAKLLGGIDDVARGDLSHALLSERDDEIGQLANRFNEMTYSLRESRVEGQRQNQAKLELEQRLAQTEKLATIGQLAAEIAHEVGTPLGVIGGRARAIQKKLDDREAADKNAQIIAEQTARITKIIQRLLDFTRRKVGHVERVEVNLNQLALTTMELLGGQFTSAKIRTTLARAEGLPKVSGDPDRLQQVLLNLLLNAIQAMPDGGVLRVETSAVKRQRPGLELSPEQRYVLIEVTDNGPGIPEELREKIFEPFFTTKGGGGGTGLGLAVCFGIVKEHDGWIEIADPPRGGTSFRVYLPALENTASGLYRPAVIS